ncbi:unnamed protein product [Amoebophrya sp. A120]|nr:unnamed protein product [Amoebophrya sp. A120]|eukprot:GSA120T00003690001.1
MRLRLSWVPDEEQGSLYDFLSSDSRAFQLFCERGLATLLLPPTPPDVKYSDLNLSLLRVGEILAQITGGALSEDDAARLYFIMTTVGSASMTVEELFETVKFLAAICSANPAQVINQYVAHHSGRLFQKMAMRRVGVVYRDGRDFAPEPGAPPRKKSSSKPPLGPMTVQWADAAELLELFGMTQNGISRIRRVIQAKPLQLIYVYDVRAVFLTESELHTVLQHAAEQLAREADLDVDPQLLGSPATSVRGSDPRAGHKSGVCVIL